MDLSITIPCLNEEHSIGPLVREIGRQVSELNLEYEVIVVDGGSRDRTVESAQEAGARVIRQAGHGFADAVMEGVRASRGEWTLMMDADFSHPPSVIKSLWAQTPDADIIIASRYVKGGSCKLSLARFLLSRFANMVYQYALGVPVRDMTSGFKIFRRHTVLSLDLKSRNFDIQPEMITLAYAQGWRIKEIPLCFMPRSKGKSHFDLRRFFNGYMKLLVKLWLRRNSAEFADYDENAYYSINPVQRFWHRRRYAIIMGLLPKGGRLVDIGCGSSRIIQDMPSAIAMDISLSKLRYIRKSNRKLVNGSAENLPLRSGAFDCALCSEVIEHIPSHGLFAEFNRILRKGGILVIATPDYSRRRWRLIELLYGILMPAGYKQAHLTQYTNATLTQALVTHGFEVMRQEYQCGADLFIQARKL